MNHYDISTYPTRLVHVLLETSALISVHGVGYFANVQFHSNGPCSHLMDSVLLNLIKTPKKPARHTVSIFRPDQINSQFIVTARMGF